jgi:hypothetical protein
MEKENIKKKIEQLLDDIFDWDLTRTDCPLLFGEVEMPEILKKQYLEKEIK